MFNKRKRDNSVKAPWGLLEEEQSSFEKSRTGRIDKKHILPSVRALLKLMLVSRSEDDFERLVLACKVSPSSIVEFLCHVQFLVWDICISKIDDHPWHRKLKKNFNCLIQYYI